MDTKLISPSHPRSSERVRWKARRSWADYSIADELGKGACGIVYQLVAETHPSDPKVVVKVAHGSAKHDDLIMQEWSIGSLLCKSVPRKQLPIVFYSAQATLDNRTCIFIEQGNLNAYDFLCLVKRKSPQEVMFARIGGVAPQLIHQLEQFHDLGYIHCDVKLDNFIQVFGPRQQEYVFKLADLGLATCYLDKAGHHTPSGRSSYFGTPAFSSKNVDEGNVQSRRDDMESLAYSLIHSALPASLPWAGKPFDEVRAMKAQISPQDLCDGLPAVFANFLIDCQRLKFEDRPDYGKWITEFTLLADVDEHTLLGMVDSGLRPSSRSASGDSLLRATGPSSGSRHSPPGDQLHLSSVPSAAASLCNVQRLKPSPSVLRDGCSKNTHAYQKPAGLRKPKDTRREVTKAAQADSILNDETRATAMAAVPHFAKPTLAFLARQRGPIRPSLATR